MSDPEAIIETIKEPEAPDAAAEPGEVVEDDEDDAEPISEVELEVPVADAVEQHRVVKIDEDEYR
jgi:hypothetical protein